MVPSLILAAAASTAAVSVPVALPTPALRVAMRGLRCPGGGRPIGDRGTMMMRYCFSAPWDGRTASP